MANSSSNVRFEGIADAWIFAGGTESELSKLKPSELNEYELFKLNKAGITVRRYENFFGLAKVILGEPELDLLIGEEVERAEARAFHGKAYSGIVPRDPSAMFRGLIMHRISKITPKSVLARITGLSETDAVNGVKTIGAKKTSGRAELSISMLPFHYTESEAETKPAKDVAFKDNSVAPVFDLGTRGGVRAFKKKAAEERVILAGENPAAEERVWCSANLVQISLPHRDPGDAGMWIRHNGNRRLIVQSGRTSSDKIIGIPYGVHPRLLLSYIIQDVVESVSSQTCDANKLEIDLGRSIYAILKNLGLSSGVANYKQMSDMALRLFASMITIETLERGTGKGGRSLDKVMLVRKHIPVADESTHPTQFWNGYMPVVDELFAPTSIKLSQKFFDELSAGAFPVHRDAIRALHNSSMQMDIYTWLCWKNKQMEIRGKSEARIPFTDTEHADGLAEQFGSTFKRPRDFRKSFIEHMKQIENVWRGKLNYSVDGDYFIFKESSPQIAPVQVQKIKQ